jgi:hypothetical protein
MSLLGIKFSCPDHVQPLYLVNFSSLSFVRIVLNWLKIGCAGSFCLAADFYLLGYDAV